MSDSSTPPPSKRRRALVKGLSLTAAGAVAGSKSSAQEAPATPMGGMAVPPPLSLEPVARGLAPSICDVCNAYCAILVEPEAGKAAPRATFGNPDPQNLHNRGRMCGKGKAGVQKVFSRDRLTRPLVRNQKTGELEESDWGVASKKIAERLKAIVDEHGENAIYALWSLKGQHSVWSSFLTGVLGTKNAFGNDAICDVGRRVGFGVTMGETRPLPDFANTRYAVLFGANPFEATKFLWMTTDLMAAMEAGARVVVVDPVFTETAARAVAHGGEWVPIRPGTDGALALAIAHVIFQSLGRYVNFLDPDFVRIEGGKLQDGAHSWGIVRYYNYVMGRTDGTPGNDGVAKTPEWAEEITGVPAATTARLADQLMTNPRSLVDAWTGVSHHESGAYQFRAIACLAGVIGCVGREGGLVFRGNARLGSAGCRPIPGANYHRKGHPETLGRACGLSSYAYADATSFLPSAIEDPGFAKAEYERRNGPGTYPSQWPAQYPIKALFVSYRNPLRSEAASGEWRRALERMRDDPGSLLVSIDVFLTETGELADIVLPEAAFSERDDLVAPDAVAPILVAARKATEPPSNCLDRIEIVRYLCKALARAEYQQAGWEVAEVLPYESYRDVMAAQLEGSNLTPRPTLQQVQARGIWPPPSPLPRYGAHRGSGFPSWGPGKSTRTFDYYSEDMAGHHANPNPTSSGAGPFAAPERFSGLPLWVPSRYCGGDGTQQHGAKYPFTLIAGGKEAVDGMTSTANLPWIAARKAENALLMNEADAERLELADGDYVEVTAATGADMVIKLRVVPGIMPGVVRAPAGFGGGSRRMRTAFDRGGNVNALTDRGAIDPVSGGSALKEMLVRIEKA